MFNNNRFPKLVNSTTGGYMPDVQARAEGAPGGEVAARALSKAHNRPRVVYRVGASVLTASRGAVQDQVGGGRRGSVKGFSFASRRRLMYMIGAIRRDAELPNFVTLTYPSAYPSVERAKRDLKIFLQRFKRAYPGAGAIWKLEPQERGAPHYHLLVWGCETRKLLQWVVWNWYEIAGNGDKNHLLFHMGVLHDSKPCVDRVRSFRGVWSYASKYLGKVFDVAEWGDKWTGRFWGVVGRDYIPFGAEREIVLPPKMVNDILRFQCRFTGIRRRRLPSLTIFCDADQWVQKLALDLRSSQNIFSEQGKH